MSILDSESVSKADSQSLTPYEKWKLGPWRKPPITNCTPSQTAWRSVTIRALSLPLLSKDGKHSSREKRRMLSFVSSIVKKICR